MNCSTPASLSITNSRNSLKLTSIKLVMPSSYLILCHPLLLPLPIPPSIRVFSKWVNSSHEVAKILEFQFQHQSFQWMWSEIAQSCPTLCNPMNCSLPDSSIHGIFQASVLEWVAIYLTLTQYGKSMLYLKLYFGHFPWGPVVKNLPCNAGDVGWSLVSELRSHIPCIN